MLQSTPAGCYENRPKSANRFPGAIERWIRIREMPVAVQIPAKLDAAVVTTASRRFAGVEHREIRLRRIATGIPCLAKLTKILLHPKGEWIALHKTLHEESLYNFLSIESRIQVSAFSSPSQSNNSTFSSFAKSRSKVFTP